MGERPFRRDIEGLRGLAVLLVVAYHLGVPGVSGGYVGVDVFFVLSGYLITGLMVREFDSTGRLAFARFYARRIRRLLPASTLVVATTLLLVAVLYAPVEMAHIGRTAKTVALYLSNLRFARGSIDYFAPGASIDPLLHTWSLGVEEQFYLLWPMLVFALLWLARGSTSRRPLVIGVAVLTIGSLAMCIALTERIQPWAFYASPPRFWEFGLGALACFVPEHIRGGILGKMPVVLACALLVIAPAFVFSGRTAYPGVWALIPVVGTAGPLASGGTPTPPTLIHRVLSWSPMQWLGRHSYSWYLWHWPLIVIGEVIVPEATLGVRLAIGLFSLACSMITFKFVEHPVRTSPTLRARTKTTLALGATLTALGLIAAVLLSRHATTLMQRPAQQRYAKASVDRPSIYGANCTVEFLDTHPANDCVFGEASSTTTVVLFGDSHAAQWFPPLEQIALARHWRLLVRIKASCPVPMIDVYTSRLHRAYRECSDWRNTVVEEIVALRPSLTIMSSASSYVANDDDPQHVTLTTWDAGLKQLTASFARANLAQVWLADTPRPDLNVPICLARNDAALFARGDCEFDRSAGIDQVVSDAVAATVVSAGGNFIDLDDAICAAPRCEVERGEIVLYSDSNHMTATFAVTLADALSARLPGGRP